jgi:DNA polymerase V
MMQSPEYIGLLDCNNFFVSCERMFRPDLDAVPVVVLSSNDGCVISRSKEAKILGIPMGVPYFEVQDILKEKKVQVFSSNSALYRDMSGRVMKVLQSLVGEVDQYSIDEAFFMLPHTRTREKAEEIKHAVYTGTGIPVSIGSAPTKTLAKLASEHAKEGGGVAVMDVEALSKNSLIPLREVWGVGRAQNERMGKYGFHTIGDITKRPIGDIRERFGAVGERLWYELSGIPTHSPKIRQQQSFMSTKSFGAPCSAYSDLEDAISYHISSIAESLRAHELVAKAGTLYLRPKGDGSIRAECTFVPTNDTSILVLEALRELKRVYVPGTRYVKAGVVLYGIAPYANTTRSLFEQGATTPPVFALVDRLNKKHGTHTVRIGTLKKTHAWASKSQYRSPAYTTRWDQIPKVKVQ